LVICFPKCPRFSNVESYAAYVAFYQFLP
jgi:hypothetical protein